MKKNNNWVVEQIRLRGGTPCLSSTRFYKIGRFHVVVNQMEQWKKPYTMIMVIYKSETTAVSLWEIRTKADRKKTEKILDALMEPSRLLYCSGMGIDEIIKAVIKDVK